MRLKDAVLIFTCSERFFFMANWNIKWQHEETKWDTFLLTFRKTLSRSSVRWNLNVQEACCNLLEPVRSKKWTSNPGFCSLINRDLTTFRHCQLWLPLFLSQGRSKFVFLVPIIIWPCKPPSRALRRIFQGISHSYHDPALNSAKGYSAVFDSPFCDRVQYYAIKNQPWF